MSQPSGAPADHWFVIDLVEKIFQGPMTLDDLKQNLAEGKVYWSDLAMCTARNFAWVRLFEIPELVALCPQLPPPEVLKHFRNIAFTQNQHVRLPLKLPAGGAPAAGASAPEARAPAAPAQPPEHAPTPTPKIRVQAPEPARPAATPPRPSPPPAAAPQSKAEWFLLIDDNEGGPFTLQEIETAFKQGKAPDRTYVWRESMKRWKPIGTIKEFRHLNAGGYGAEFADEPEEDTDFRIENYRNVRRSFRKSIVAGVMRISENGIRQLIGVCGDISPEGFQLHQDTFQVSYPINSRHVLEIRPMRLTHVRPFRVTAVVRWMNPDTHAIGFQFMQLNPNDLKILDHYLKSQKS